MLQKKIFTSLFFATILLFAACGGKKSPTPTNDVVSQNVDTAAAEQTADSTLYGTSTEDFGMSTFSMVTDKGDTLHVCRTAEDGTDGEIYGSLDYGQRYAMTTRENGTAIGVLINLTELDKKVKDYEINNGKLIVDGDTVSPKKYLN